MMESAQGEPIVESGLFLRRASYDPAGGMRDATTTRLRPASLAA